MPSRALEAPASILTRRGAQGALLSLCVTLFTSPDGDTDTTALRSLAGTRSDG